MDHPQRCPAGSSLIELLIVIAIISILLGMYMSTFSKVFQKARMVEAQAAGYQHSTGKMADNANSVHHEADRAERDACREAYYTTLDTSSGPIRVTQMLYRVTNEDEFRAYWYTLIDPDATGALEFLDGDLVARDELGNAFLLQPLGDDPWVAHGQSGVFPVMWEFLSTDMGEMNSNNRGISVSFSDGHVEYIPYPHRFPSSPIVAQLSHIFLKTY